MGRRSILVYDLLKSEKQNNGFLPNEIFKHVSELYDITPGKGLKKQVNVALRRGLDFGILARKNRRYIYDSHPNDPSNQPAERKAKAKLKPKARQKSKIRKKTLKKPRKSSTSSKSRRQKAPSSSQKQSYNSPRPRVPPPPNWEPNKRNIREEAIPKFIKHHPYSPCLL